jgi:WD40 repeat protein
MRKIAPLLIAMMVTVTVPLAYAQDDPVPFELRHQLGRGTPDRIQWQPGGDRLLVSSVTGAWSYTDTLEDITHIANVRLASFGPDGTNLAAIDGENGVVVWDSLTLEPVFTFSNFHYPERIIALEWSPGGDRLASMYEDGTVIICPINSTLTCRDLWLPDGTSLAWSTDGTYLAVATDAGRIQVWDVESGDPVFSLLEISRAYIHIHILWRNDRHLLRWQRGDSALGIVGCSYR